MNNEFRKLVMTKEFWKDIPEEFQWVAVDGSNGSVFVYEYEPELGTGCPRKYCDEWFDNNDSHRHVAVVGYELPTKPDKLSRKECMLDQPKQYRLVIESVVGTTYSCDPFECSEEGFKETVKETMYTNEPVLIARIREKSVRFQVSSIVCMYFEEV